MQNGRKFDMPRVVDRRMVWKPSGASAGTSRTTRSDVGCFPLFMSVGIVTLAGKLVHRPVGSVKFVPVRVRSSFVPRCMPSGAGGLSVGACGLGTGNGGGGWATETAGADNRTNSRRNRHAFMRSDRGWSGRGGLKQQTGGPLQL